MSEHFFDASRKEKTSQEDVSKMTGTQFREAREALGLSRNDMRRKMGVSLKRLTYWEDQSAFIPVLTYYALLGVQHEIAADKAGE